MAVKIEYFYWLRLPNGEPVKHLTARVIFPNRASASFYKFFNCQDAKIIKEAYS